MVRCHTSLQSESDQAQDILGNVLFAKRPAPHELPAGKQREGALFDI